MRALMLLLSATLVFSSSMSMGLPGSNPCTRGPGHWCSSPEAARQCGAVAHCVQLWRDSNVGPALDDASDSCTVCQLLSTDLGRLAAAGRSPGEMLAAAGAACSLSSAADGCRRLVTSSSGASLAHLISAGLQPGKACVLARQCRSGGTATKPATAARLRDYLLLRGAPLSAWKPQLAVRQGADLCDGCIQVLADIKTSFASNKTQAEIASDLKSQVCPQLGPLTDLCNQFADQYLGIVLAQLSQDMQPQQICLLFDFCNASSKAMYRRHPVLQLMQLQAANRKDRSPISTVQCELCETLVSEARQMLRDGKTQAEIEKFVEDTVCKLLPVHDQCVANVREYGPIIFQLLASELDPLTVCQALGACGAAAAKAKKLRAGPQCLLCEFVIREVEQELGQNATQAQIEAALEKVCASLPQTIRSECNSFVQQYTPVIIQLLVSGLSPEKVCTTLGLCSQFRRPLATRRVLSSSTAECDTCQTVIIYVKALLKENATEQEIVQTLEKVCNFLPKAEQAQCRSWVDEFGAFVVQMLIQGVNPKQICQYLGICPNARSKPVRPRLPVVRAGPQCLMCELVIREVEQQLGQNATQAQIEAALDGVCALLPQTVRQECINFVQQYTPILIQLLVNGVTPEKVCTTLGLCTQSRHRPMSVRSVPTVSAKSTPVSSTTCDICQTVIQYAKTLLNDNATEQEILQLVEKVCNFLPASDQAQCKSYIDQYGPYVIQLLLQDVDPQQICQMLGLCTTAKSKLTAAPRLQKVRAGPQCLMCELVIREVEQQLGQNATQAQIEAALDGVCALLPQTVRQECINFVQQYTPILIQLLVNGVTPEKVCTTLGLCTQSRHRQISTKRVAAALTKPPRVESTVCEICKTVVQYAKTLLNDNATEQEIVQTLEKVCNFLPSAEQAQCRSFIDQYGPYVIQLLLQDVDPQQICQMLGLCTSAKSKLTATPRLPKLRAGPQCLLCEFVIREVEQELGQNATQAQIEAALEKVCASLPQTIRSECNSFVQQYTPVIIQLLVSGLSPEKVCTTLGLCSQFRRPLATRRVLSSSAATCDTCQTVIIYVKGLLNENATEQEIVQTVEKVCNFLPATEQAQCRSFIDQYGIYVIQMLMQDVNPKQICQYLGLCPSARTKPVSPRLPVVLGLGSGQQPAASQTLRFVQQHVESTKRRAAPSGLVQMVHKEHDLPLI